MAQVMIENTRQNFQLIEFDNIQQNRKKRSITCRVNETVTIVLKKSSTGINIKIVNASKYVTLTRDVFRFICNANVSVLFLCSLLETL